MTCMYGHADAADAREFFLVKLRALWTPFSHSELDMFIVFVEEVEVERRPMLARWGRMGKAFFQVSLRRVQIPATQIHVPLQAIGCL